MKKTVLIIIIFAVTITTVLGIADRLQYNEVKQAIESIQGDINPIRNYISVYTEYNIYQRLYDRFNPERRQYVRLQVMDDGNMQLIYITEPVDYSTHEIRHTDIIYTAHTYEESQALLFMCGLYSVSINYSSPSSLSTIDSFSHEMYYRDDIQKEGNDVIANIAGHIQAWMKVRELRGYLESKKSQVVSETVHSTENLIDKIFYLLGF